MTTIKSISIIIPNYNGAQILQENLPRVIQAAKKYNAPIIVIDDKSTDNSLSVLQQFKPQITLITKEKNEGFSSTVNLGVRNADTELICLLNSDVIPPENFLDPMFQYFDDPNIAAVGFKDLSDDQDSHGRGKFIFHRGFILHQKLTTQNGQLTTGKTGWVSCGSGVFSKKIWDKLGGLDELLNPFYFEDVDYGYRAWKSGYTMYFESIAIVDHAHKQGAIKSNFDEKRITTISYRNQFFFNWTNMTDADLVFKHLLWLVFHLLRSGIKGDVVFLTAFSQAIKRSSTVLVNRDRKVGQSKKTDKDVIRIVAEE